MSDQAELKPGDYFVLDFTSPHNLLSHRPFETMIFRFKEYSRICAATYNNRNFDKRIVRKATLHQFHSDKYVIDEHERPA